MSRAKPPVNIWFRPVERGRRKSCSFCNERLDSDGIYCWGEYVRAKWRNIRDFCRKCWDGVRERCLQHGKDSGRELNINCNGHQPWWINLGSRDLPTIDEVEEKLASPRLSWAGRCHEIAVKTQDLFDLDARPCYGHYTGPVVEGYFRADRPFQRHGWLELWDGRVFDPTRWVFETDWPPGVFEADWPPTALNRVEVYVGPKDHYDLGGQLYLAAQLGGQWAEPPAYELLGDEKAVTLRIRGEQCRQLTAWLRRWFPRNNHWCSTEEGVLLDRWTLSPLQVWWMSKLPLQFLEEHAISFDLYDAIVAAGAGYAIPLDQRVAVLGDKGSPAAVAAIAKEVLGIGRRKQKVM